MALIGLLLLILALQKISPTRGLKGRYYPNNSWEGVPILEVVDQNIRFDDKKVSAKIGDVRQYSIIWEGYVFAPRSAKYLFEIASDDGSWVYLDDGLLIDNGGIHPVQNREREVFISRGNHKVTIKYFDQGIRGLIVFRWKATNALRIIMPGLHLYPKPVNPGVVVLDTILPAFTLLLKAVFLIACLLFLLLISKIVHPFYEKCILLEQKAWPRDEEPFAFVRKNRLLFATIIVGLLAIVVAERALSPKHGLRGRYYANKDWAGQPVTTALDSIIRLDKKAMALRTGDAKEFSIIWDGFVYVPKRSTYRFSIRSDAGSRVYVDDVLLIGSEGNHPEQWFEKEIELSRGSHKLLINYSVAGDEGRIDFRWRETKTPKMVMPRLYMYSSPINTAQYILDALLWVYFRPILRAILFVFGLLVLSMAFQAVFPRLELLSIVALSLFIILTGIYGAEVFSKKSKAVTGCDTYSYLQGADLMARNGFLRTEYVDPLIPLIHQNYTTKAQEDKEIFLLSPHGHYVHDLDRGLVYNVFPPGMSMLLYPIVKLGGRTPAFYVLPFLNLIFLVLLFCYGAKSVNTVFGLVLGVAAMANLHVFQNTILIMSDVPSMALLSLSAFSLYRNIKAPRRLWPFIAGASFGFSVVVRYSNLVGGLPLACLFWIEFRERRPRRDLFKDLLSFAAAAFLFGALPLSLYTNHLFGTVFRLVYEPLTQSKMSLANVGAGISFYLNSLLKTFGAPVVTLMAVGFAANLLRPRRRAVGLVCLLALFGFLAFYSFQSIRHDRYLMPAYPFLAALFGFGVLELLKAFKRSRVVTILIVALCAVYPLRHSISLYHYGNMDEENIALKLRNKIPRNAVVFCDQMSGPLRLYAGIPGYRFTWTDSSTLKETISVLEKKEYEMYFFLDSPAAEDAFSSLLDSERELEKTMRPEARVWGMPLYRIQAQL